MKTRLNLLALAGLSLGLFTSASAAVETYAIDPVHSSVGFSIRRFFAKVPGSFTTFRGNIVVDREHPEKNSVEASIDIGSINTADPKRDEHLRSPDFFDAAKFTQITFKSTAWKKTGDDAYDVTGALTMHGVTKEVVLKVKLLGIMPGMRPGSQLSGWEASTTLKRADFGVNGPAMLGNMLGADVEVSINVSADSKS